MCVGDPRQVGPVASAIKGTAVSVAMFVGPLDHRSGQLHANALQSKLVSETVQAMATTRPPIQDLGGLRHVAKGAQSFCHRVGRRD